MIQKYRKSRLLAVIIVFLCFFSELSYATETWTLTALGRINSGMDTSGGFGMYGKSISGYNYELSITSIVDANRWSYPYSDPSKGIKVFGGFGPEFKTSITINNHTLDFYSSYSFSGSQSISNALSRGLTGAAEDLIGSFQSGNGARGDQISAYIFLSSDVKRFVSTLDFTQKLSVEVNPLFYTSTARFSSQGNLIESMDGSIDHLFVNTSAVPEPSVGGMLLLGLFLLILPDFWKRIRQD